MKGLCRLLLMVLWGAAAAHAGEVATFQPQDPGSDDPEYFPVPKVGSVTEFSVTLKFGDKPQEGTMKVKIEKEEEIKGRKYLQQITDLLGLQNVDHSVTYYRYADDGIHVIEGVKKDAPDYVNPPFPLAIGKEWTFINPTTTITARCKAEGIEDVKIGNQTFKDCLKISETEEFGKGLGMVLETWYAPKIGPVKMAMKSGIVGNQMEMECLIVKPSAK